MKFTTRDLFWLILIVAMGLGWSLTAITIRRIKLDRDFVFVAGHMQGQKESRMWWNSKAEAISDPAIRDLILKHVKEQPMGGGVEIPEGYY
ncbi:hypothetical protein ETAA8_33330 [Anatilimnocola aggregata]|uniref:Uncharacterized protein n=1 Tax=Anatilimnocola aggregata TaxID=2528021 RepID=A0A517YDB8_9BACT|nr:hypothetical protein [Anatilimnocola aggregata]QDU28233.1 hypothetical protein ETAA8_33330 [Anatilimnocola aggregata]